MTTDLTPLVSIDVPPGLTPYFTIHPLGIEVVPGVEPPQTAWETLVFYLAGKADSLAWQIAATVNRYPRQYHQEIALWFATLTGLSHWTIQQWAYIERNVPLKSRCSLTIWFHRVVAKIDNPDLQFAYLGICQDNGWTIGQFENWLTLQGAIVDEQHYQSDRKFEEEQQLYQSETDNADLRRENEILRARLEILETTPKTNEPPAIAPADLPDYATRALGDIENVLLEFSYSSVTVYQNGDVRWHK